MAITAYAHLGGQTMGSGIVGDMAGGGPQSKQGRIAEAKDALFFVRAEAAKNIAEALSQFADRRIQYSPTHDSIVRLIDEYATTLGGQE